MSIVIFDKDEDAYLAWIHQHPEGFVLNRRRGGLSKNYLMLHTPGCALISTYTQMAQPGGFTTRKYIKVCSQSLADLRSYVRAECGRIDKSFTGKCKKCSPNAGTPAAT